MCFLPENCISDSDIENGKKGDMCWKLKVYFIWQKNTSKKYIYKKRWIINFYTCFFFWQGAWMSTSFSFCCQEPHKVPLLMSYFLPIRKIIRFALLKRIKDEGFWVQKSLSYRSCNSTLLNSLILIVFCCKISNKRKSLIQKIHIIRSVRSTKKCLKEKYTLSTMFL